MPTRRAADAKVTSQDIAAIRTLLQAKQVPAGTVDDLVRGVVGNQTRRAQVEHLCAWLRARPKQ